MAKTINAVYENGVFRPETPFDLPEGTAVRIVVESTPTAPQQPLTGQALLDVIARISSKARRGPPENTSENVDAILYGVKGDPGDVR